MQRFPVCSKQIVKLNFPPATNKGWGSRLIGFREVILATENIGSINEPINVLRWIFKVFDINATGFMRVVKIPRVVRVLIKLCIPMSAWQSYSLDK